MDLISQFNSSPRDFPGGKLDDLAGEVRARILKTVSRNGGHLASSLGAVELTIALLKVFDPLRDRIVWDVGHQTYGWKILTGRNALFGSMRLYGGISGFPRRDESPADAFGAGHAGAGISAALGMAAARDAAGENHSVVAITGDGSIANGMSLEALNNASTATRKFIIVLNDNEMSIDENVGALSRHLGRLLASRKYNAAKRAVESAAKKLRLGVLAGLYHGIESRIKSIFVKSILFEDLGIRYVGPIDGHDIDGLVKALSVAKEYDRPIVLHISTQKGKGFPPAEENPSKWHGTPPFALHGKDAQDAPQEGRSFSDVFGKTLCLAAERDARVAAITAAMRSGTGLDGFSRAFPNRFFDVGICEEHALTFAAGLAAGGMRPFAAVYSTFAQRAVDSVFHDIALQKLPVTICLDRAGIVGQDGSTHHGIYDIALLRPFPSLAIAQPRNASIFRDLVDLSLSSGNPFVIRYPRGRCPDGESPPAAIGKAQILRRPPDAAKHLPVLWFWALGDMLPAAFEAADRLESLSAARVGIVDPVFIKPLDGDLVLSQAREGGRIVTLENGTLQGGFGSAVMESLSGEGLSGAVTSFGWGDEPPRHGKMHELFKAGGLDGQSIAASLADMLAKGRG